MYHSADREQLTQRFKFMLPLPRQLVQQGIRLRLRQFQFPEESQQRADFVHRKSDHRDHKGDRDVNLKSKFGPG